MKRALSFLLTLSLLGSLLANTLPARAANANLMANPQVNTVNSSNQPSNWTANSWGTNNASLKYVTNSGHGDSTSLSTSITSYSNGDAKWIPDATSVTAGQAYTYSDWYESSATTELDAQYTNASGAVSYVYLATLAPSSTWSQAVTSFTVPANTTKVSVIHILYSAGSLQTDDFSLSQNVVLPPPTSGNLMANPSFETTNGNQPANWNQGSWGTNNAQFSYSSNAHTGSRSATVSITSYTSGDAKWYANLVSITPGQAYIYSDWYQSNAATQVVVAYIDGSGNYTYANLANVPASSTWAQYKATFTPPAGTKQVTIYHLLSSVGSLTIDDVDLEVASSTTTPPPSGNIIPNNSVETANPNNSKLPLDWLKGSWGTNTTSFSYLNTGHTGTRSVKTQISSYTSGAAYWYFDNQPVTGGQMYDFNDYFESNIPSEIDATFTMSDGSTQDVYVGDAFASPNSWTNFDAQFEAPVGAVSVTIQHNIYQVGWLTTDDFSMTPFSYQGFSRPIISITDDDGYASFYTNGLPVLQKYGLTSTDYIITSYVGNVSGYMSSAQVKGLYAAGEEIGSHSVDHPDLTTLSATKADNELKNSQIFLQNLLSIPIIDYAAPYGSTNNAITTDAAKYYQTYRSVEAGYNAKNNFNAYNLQVQNIVDTTTLADVQSWIAEAKATNTWLILVYHQVDPNPSAGDYNTYPSDFDAQMSAIKSSGIAVETVKQAMAEITPQL